jgi:hypothetical protein
LNKPAYPKRFEALRWLIFTLHLAVVFAFHEYAYTGHYGFDDLEYAEMAHDLLEGNTDWDNHFAHRLAITGPTALAYALFGINDMASALPGLVYTCLIGLVIVLLLRRHHPLVLSFALSLALFPLWFIYYTDKLMPDTAVAFYTLGAVACYVMSRKEGSDSIRLGMSLSV